MTTSKHPKYITRTTQLTVLPKGDETYSEGATTITIIAEAEGDHVVVEQHGQVDLRMIEIGPEEWPSLRGAIDRLIDDCRPTPPLSTPAG